MVIGIEKQLEAYKLIFTIENKLRVGMHNIMVNKRDLIYFTNENFPNFRYEKVSGEKEIDIISLATNRKNIEKEINISLGYDYPLFWYLDYAVLIAVLDTFWEHYFKDIFLRPRKHKNEILSRLDTLNPIRNAIAHNRYISNIDFADITNSFVLLEKLIVAKYLSNFDEIVMNTKENLIVILEKYCDDFSYAINNNQLIHNHQIRMLLNNLSGLMMIAGESNIYFDIIELQNIIKSYNQLPRKPGRGDDLKEFKKKTKILKKIKELRNYVRRLA